MDWIWNVENNPDETTFFCMLQKLEWLKEISVFKIILVAMQSVQFLYLIIFLVLAIKHENLRASEAL